MAEQSFNAGDHNLVLGIDESTTEVSLKDSEGDVLATYKNGEGWVPVDGDNLIYAGGSTVNEYIATHRDQLTTMVTNEIKNYDYDNRVKFSAENSQYDPYVTHVETVGLEQTTSEAISRIPTANYPSDPEGFFYGKYPLNQTNDDDYDYFKITCYDHQPSIVPGQGEGFYIDDIDDRKKVRRGVVTLPMQPGIQESNAVNWGADNLNPLQILGANVAMPLMDFNFKEAMNQVLKGADQAGGDINAHLIKSYFAGKAIGSNLIGRATGQTINNNVEVLFNGPELRTFTYQYRFTPREPREARGIKRIIRFFKKQMAPKRSTSRIFLKSPNVFKLKYTFRDGSSHPFLNNIKMCALGGFTVNYTPDGSYSTYNDDGEGDGSMASYDVGLTFKEMTPIYNDDYWTDQEGREGTGF